MKPDPGWRTPGGKAPERSARKGAAGCGVLVPSVPLTGRLAVHEVLLPVSVTAQPEKQNQQEKHTKRLRGCLGKSEIHRTGRRKGSLDVWGTGDRCRPQAEFPLQTSLSSALKAFPLTKPGTTHYRG